MEILPMDKISEVRRARPQSANIHIKKQEMRKKQIKKDQVYGTEQTNQISTD